MDKLNKVRNIADNLGLDCEIYISNRKNKKYDCIYDNKKISFGDSRYQDYLDHHNRRRRLNYRKRHSKIYTKNGTKAIDIPYSPAFLSYYLLW